MNKATLFVDESGKSSLAEKQNEPFILTGIILEHSDLITIEGFFNYIKRKFGIPIDQPFHSYHIFEHPTKKVSISNAQLLSRKLADFISLIPITIFIFKVDKNEFKATLGVKDENDFKGSSDKKELKEFPYRLMASYLFENFADYLKTRDTVGEIIADSRKGGDHQLLKTLHLCKEGRVPLKISTSDVINCYIQAISFAEKRYLSGGLEITDLISYVSFFHFRRLMSSQKETGIDIIWKKIRNKAHIQEVTANQVRSFFNIKKGEVHKYLKHH